jgi:hypothetical protein
MPSCNLRTVPESYFRFDMSRGVRGLQVFLESCSKAFISSEYASVRHERPANPIVPPASGYNESGPRCRGPDVVPANSIASMAYRPLTPLPGFKGGGGWIGGTFGVVGAVLPGCVVPGCVAPGCVVPGWVWPGVAGVVGVVAPGVVAPGVPGTVAPGVPGAVGPAPGAPVPAPVPPVPPAPAPTPPAPPAPAPAPAPPAPAARADIARAPFTATTRRELRSVDFIVVKLRSHPPAHPSGNALSKTSGKGLSRPARFSSSATLW